MISAPVGFFSKGLTAYYRDGSLANYFDCGGWYRIVPLDSANAAQTGYQRAVS